jgi:membrane protease YdiL (CAAX protease family)
MGTVAHSGSHVSLATADLHTRADKVLVFAMIALLLWLLRPVIATRPITFLTLGASLQRLRYIGRAATTAAQRLGSPVMPIAIAIALVAMKKIVPPLTTLLPTGGEWAQNATARIPSSQLVIWTLSICVVAPLAEELCFRRALYTALYGNARRRISEPYAVTVAIVLSSLAFAATHVILGDGAWTMWSRFLAGVVFAVVFWRTGSVLASTLVHGLSNFLALPAHAAPAVVDLVVLLCVALHIGQMRLRTTTARGAQRRTGRHDSNHVEA